MTYVARQTCDNLCLRACLLSCVLILGSEQISVLLWPPVNGVLGELQSYQTTVALSTIPAFAMVSPRPVRSHALVALNLG